VTSAFIQFNNRYCFTTLAPAAWTTIRKKNYTIAVSCFIPSKSAWLLCLLLPFNCGFF